MTSQTIPEKINVSELTKILDLFKEDKIDNKPGYKVYDDNIIGYFASLLSMHNNLLTYNRRFFMGVSIGLGGLASIKLVKIIPCLLSYEAIPDRESGIIVLLIFGAGLICNAFWKTTTYYRAHQVYFLSIILNHLELGKVLKESFSCPMHLISTIDYKHLTNIICNSKYTDPVTRKVTECAARDTFKTLRILHLLLWSLCGLIGLNIIYMGDIVLYNKVLINLVLILCSIVFSIYNSISSTDKLY